MRLFQSAGLVVVSAAVAVGAVAGCGSSGSHTVVAKPPTAPAQQQQAPAPPRASPTATATLPPSAVTFTCTPGDTEFTGSSNTVVIKATNHTHHWVAISEVRGYFSNGNPFNKTFGAHGVNGILTVGPGQTSPDWWQALTVNADASGCTVTHYTFIGQ